MEIAGIDLRYGPRIAGSRITVYDVYYYLDAGWTVAAIAELFSLTVEQIQAAVQYIELHRDEVHAVHEKIEARNARGNSPEVEAKMAATRVKIQSWLEVRRQSRDMGLAHIPWSQWR